MGLGVLDGLFKKLRVLRCGKTVLLIEIGFASSWLVHFLTNPVRPTTNLRISCSIKKIVLRLVAYTWVDLVIA
jgi:hypothetical protein